MKILILLNHSRENRALAEITQKNTWRYAARHNYDVMWLREQWDAAKVRLLERLRDLLPLYDAVVTIGSDVLFMNHSIRFQDIIQKGDDVVMALERLGEKAGYQPDQFSPINNDVAIWRNTAMTSEIIDNLIDKAPQWLAMRNLWQQYLAEFFMADGKIEGIRFVEPRVLNACLQPCSGRYQPGDFILHLLAMPYEDKCVAAMVYLRQVLG